MGRIYRGQSALRITVKTFINLEEMAEAIIKYRKPNGVCGELTAGVSDEAKGTIFHECIEGELDVSGWWSFWAFVTFADGRTAAGETAKVYVWEEGNR